MGLRSTTNSPVGATQTSFCAKPLKRRDHGRIANQNNIRVGKCKSKSHDNLLNSGLKFNPKMAIDIDERIGQFIDSHRVAHLATTDASGEPLIVPICFAFDGACFFTAIDEKPKTVSASALRRVQNIRTNPQVALLMDDYSEDWSQLAYLLIKGTARIIEPLAEWAWNMPPALHFSEPGMHNTAQWPLTKIP